MFIAGLEKLKKIVSLLFGLLDAGFVFKESDKKDVGPMWKLTWSVLIEIVETCVVFFIVFYSQFSIYLFI